MKKKLILFLMLSLVFVVFTACDMNDNGTNNDVFQSFNLTISIEGQGETEPEAGTHEYEWYSMAEVKAIPEEGWEFDYWSGDYPSGSVADKEISLLMSEDKEITAHFKKISPGSKENPAKLNETIEVTFIDSWLHGDVTYEITMLDAIRGEEAWEIIDEATAIVSPPKEGEEYILVQFEITAIYLSEEPFDISAFNFEAVRQDGQVYDESGSDIGLQRTELEGGRISAELYEGGTTKGWVYLLIEEDDNPWITFLRNVDAGDTWFTLD